MASLAIELPHYENGDIVRQTFRFRERDVMRFDKIIGRLSGLAVAALALTGCGVHETLVGKWVTSISSPTGGGATVTTVFNADGSEIRTLQIDQHTVVITARWKAVNGQLTEQFLSATADGKPNTSQHLTTQVTNYELDGNSMYETMPGKPGTVTYTRVFAGQGQ